MSKRKLQELYNQHRQLKVELTNLKDQIDESRHFNLVQQKKLTFKEVTLFFQIETGITVSKWVKVACGTVQSMPFASTSYSLSCTTKDISPNDDVLGLPPLVVGSFDIESYGWKHVPLTVSKPK